MYRLSHQWHNAEIEGGSSLQEILRTCSPKMCNSSRSLQNQKMLTHKSIPISFWPWTQSILALLEEKLMGSTLYSSPDVISLLQTASSVDNSRDSWVLCRCMGIFRCPLSASALLCGEHGQPWLHAIILLVGGDASAHLDLPFVKCPGFCRAEGELCQNQPSSPSFPNDEFLHCYLQEERMERKAIIFTVSFTTYCICLRIFLHHLILYFCNYFPISIDNIMALLLVTLSLLLYFSSWKEVLITYNIRLHHIWGILFSQNKHDSFLISCVLIQKLLLLKIFHSLGIYPFYRLNASRTYAYPASNSIWNLEPGPFGARLPC